ncbi:MAG TPA: TasA family protein, partial [Coriobacteriia bacterium]
MSKKILLSILAIAVVVGMVGVGTYALWTDSVTSAGNSFATGSLSLTVNGYHDPGACFAFSNLKPGEYKTITFNAKNTGSIDGKLSAVGAFS